MRAQFKNWLHMVRSSHSRLEDWTIHNWLKMHWLSHLRRKSYGGSPENLLETNDTMRTQLITGLESSRMTTLPRWWSILPIKPKSLSVTKWSIRSSFSTQKVTKRWLSAQWSLGRVESCFDNRLSKFWWIGWMVASESHLQRRVRLG